ncbi:hypothetical protein LBUL_0817 [Lactobacillus delbrueckii subsp. bulgaricus ATCC BAA-365]|nr:hypothetical protein LBUL_0817 [Lactobacillus delbrueckii subsp. bulgaricus ATCC BAA-365]
MGQVRKKIKFFCYLKTLMNTGFIRILYTIQYVNSIYIFLGEDYT